MGGLSLNPSRAHTHTRTAAAAGLGFGFGFRELSRSRAFFLLQISEVVLFLELKLVTAHLNMCALWLSNNAITAENVALFAWF